MVISSKECIFHNLSTLITILYYAVCSKVCLDSCRVASYVSNTILSCFLK